MPESKLFIQNSRVIWYCDYVDNSLADDEGDDDEGDDADQYKIMYTGKKKISQVVWFFDLSMIYARSKYTLLL